MYLFLMRILQNQYQTPQFKNNKFSIKFSLNKIENLFQLFQHN